MPVPYYFNHEMAIVMAGARAVPVPTTARLSARPRRDRRARSRRGRAPSSPCRRTIRPAPSIRRRRCAPSTRSAATRGIFHIHDEAYEYFTYDDARHFSPGSIAGARRSHDLALLAVEGVRHGELAHRLHGDSRRAVGRRSTRFRTRCSSARRRVAARGARRARASAARYARAHLAALDADAARMSCARSATPTVPCDVAAVARRVLLLPARAARRSIR